MSNNSLPVEKRPYGRVITNDDIEVLQNQCCCGKCKFCDCINSTCKLRHKTIMVNEDEYEATKVLVRIDRIFMGEEMPVYKAAKGFVPQYKEVYQPVDMQHNWCQRWQHKGYDETRAIMGRVIVTKYLINPSDDGIWCILDEFNTREDAIKEGVQQYNDAMNGLCTDLFDEDDEDGNIPTTFCVGEKHEFEPCVDADSIIEYVGCCAYDECGEIAEDYLYDVPRETVDNLQDKIQSVFDDWLDDNNLRPSFYSVINIEEIDVRDYM